MTVLEGVAYIKDGKVKHKLIDIFANAARCGLGANWDYSKSWQFDFDELKRRPMCKKCGKSD